MRIDINNTNNLYIISMKIKILYLSIYNFKNLKQQQRKNNISKTNKPSNPKLSYTTTREQKKILSKKKNSFHQQTFTYIHQLNNRTST